jgi:hypothetical protein
MQIPCKEKHTNQWLPHWPIPFADDKTYEFCLVVGFEFWPKKADSFATPVVAVFSTLSLSLSLSDCRSVGLSVVED